MRDGQLFCGFWILWRLAFGFRGFLAYAKERRREGRKAGRKQGRGLLRRVAFVASVAVSFRRLLASVSWLWLAWVFSLLHGTRYTEDIIPSTQDPFQVLVARVTLDVVEH